MEKQSSWIDHYTVRSYEVDVNHTIQLSVLCNFLQESAWHHAENLGYGYFTLSEKRKMWVLTKMVLKIDRLPVWDETVSVETWPKGTERLFALRDFSVKDTEKHEIIAATSFWLLLDADSRRPMKLETFREEIPLSENRHAVQQKYSKTEGITETGGDLPADRLTVRYSELDQNNHVNNVHYIRWFVDSYTPDFLAKHKIDYFEIHYLNEALYQDDLEVRTQMAEGGVTRYRHEVRRTVDQSVLCRGTIAWSLL